MSSTGFTYYPDERLSVAYSTKTSLNTLDIYLPSNAYKDTSSRYWIIYIHGGAWRDPLITSASVRPTLPHLSPTDLPIAGIVSLNYRLSPYPSHPTHPSQVDEKSRNARHPDHIKDVVTAIKWLQKKYGFDHRYVLVGHSCGATLAMQVAMGVWNSIGDEAEKEEGKYPMPAAIVGVAGIYNMKLLRDTHAEIPAYEVFTKGAFGDNEDEWDKASPTNGKYAKTWPGGRVMVVAHSREDELVDWAQVEAIGKILHKEREDGRSDKVLELKGKHHDIWKEGAEMARAIKEALQMLDVQD